MQSMKKARATLALSIGVAVALIAVIAFLLVGRTGSDGSAESTQERQSASAGFVTVENGGFVIAGKSYRFAGANF